MSRYEYDEEASAAWHMDVLHEVDDSPAPVSRWVDAMRRLNTINDPLARKLHLAKPPGDLLTASPE